MAMYAVSGDRRTRQIMQDIGAALFTVAWVLGMFYVQRLIDRMRQPAQDLMDSGTQIHDSFTGAAQAVNVVPIGLGQLGEFLTKAVEAGDKLSASGRRLQDTAEQLSTIAWVVMPIVLVVFLVAYIARRLHFAKESRAAELYVRQTGNLDFFALRALARQSTTKLTALHPDTAGAWRSGNLGIIGELARMELEDNGVHAPKPTADQHYGPGSSSTPQRPVRRPVDPDDDVTSPIPGTRRH